MNYFKNEDNEIFAYSNEQVEQGYGNDLIEIENPIKNNGKLYPNHKKFRFSCYK